MARDERSNAIARAITAFRSNIFLCVEKRRTNHIDEDQARFLIAVTRTHILNYFTVNIGLTLRCLLVYYYRNFSIA